MKERIDTSKYDGHTTTSCDDDYEKIEWQPSIDHNRVCLTRYEFGQEFVTIGAETIMEYGPQMQPLSRDVNVEADIRLMADAPKILAELKSCYEFIDRLQMHVDAAWATYDKQVNAKYSNNDAS